MPKQRRGGGFFSRFDTSQLRITRGALILLFAQAGLSIVWLLSDEDVRLRIMEWFAPNASQVIDHYRVWTLATGPFLEPDFAGLLFITLTLWWFVPALERWWGFKRFMIFFVATSLAGTIAGTLTGLATGVGNISVGAPGYMASLMVGYSPFVYASIVAFGILYGKQPVQFFGVLPMTGRQLMYGILGFVALFVVLGEQWEKGGSYVASMGLAALMASGKWAPRLWWYKWRHGRAKKKLGVIDGGRPRVKRPTDDLLN